MRSCWRSFVDTLTFLSIAPNLRREPLEPEEFGRFPAFYPAVGLVFGLLLAGLWLALSPLLPPVAAATLVVTLLVILNRGFHLDGLADAADALLSHRSRERKLEIMKDSRQGTFGVLAIVLDILLKAQLVAVVANQMPQILIFWPLWGRAACSVVAVKSPYVGSPLGLARYMVECSGGRELIFAALFTIFLSALAGPTALVCALAALLLGWALVWVWDKLLGGVTGDLLGASIEITELITIGLFSLLLPLLG